MDKEEDGHGGRHGQGALLERLRQSDARAWAEFNEAYRNKIFSFSIRMLRSREEAEDVCQEVFLRAAGSIAGFRGDASLGTWLCTIARNCCLTCLETRERRGKTVDESWMLEIADDNPGPDHQLVSSELRKAMSRAIGTLEPEFREAILLREVNQLSYEEIAKVTNANVGTVKTRIHRARVKLQDLLAEYRP